MRCIVQASVFKRPNGIAVFMSSCRPSWRLRLVQELQRLAEIDTFGRCFPGRPSTSPWTHQGNAKLASMTDYKVVLALENSACTDYATEMLYGPLLHGAVPIYLGPSTCWTLATPGQLRHI